MGKTERLVFSREKYFADNPAREKTYLLSRSRKSWVDQCHGKTKHECLPYLINDAWLEPESHWLARQGVQKDAK